MIYFNSNPLNKLDLTSFSDITTNIVNTSDMELLSNNDGIMSNFKLPSVPYIDYSKYNKQTPELDLLDEYDDKIYINKWLFTDPNGLEYKTIDEYDLNLSGIFEGIQMGGGRLWLCDNYNIWKTISDVKSGIYNLSNSVSTYQFDEDNFLFYHICKYYYMGYGDYASSLRFNLYNPITIVYGNDQYVYDITDYENKLNNKNKKFSINRKEFFHDFNGTIYTNINLEYETLDVKYFTINNNLSVACDCYTLNEKYSPTIDSYTLKMYGQK